MNIRLAVMDDLPRLKSMYGEIVAHMNERGLHIWDDVYPCEFLGSDIENNRLYVLMDDDEITSAFALCGSHAGADSVEWVDKDGHALYIDRLGVSVKFLRKGVGSLLLQHAVAAARGKGAAYLRLFVMESNAPAINLYRKNGFRQVAGFYDEVIDDDLVLHEFGFEMET